MTEALKQLLSKRAIALVLKDLADKIACRNRGNTAVVLIGIQRGGVHLAVRISRLLETLWRQPVPVGNVDVSMHRDDLDHRLPAHVHPTEIPFDLNGKTVV
ncbi:MAG TPA: bifunctional pyr operon transcriptional regulator/uracil phosphoribosyltransferase, partial [Verrucomicrobiota bacterium]|nr:bifunctional pyr operon transcriptional regulator/uracil phosphoribosyltransferase [Verrucomicrobiota bacterium]